TGNYTYSWTHGGLGFSQDSIAVIANATSADSGPYILTVSNGANCISQPYTINTSFIDAPPVPTIPVSASGNLICAGDNISLSTNPVSGGATYQWSTPTGIVTTTNPSLQIPSSSSINSGIYFVQAVSVNGCLSGPSAELPITVITAQPPAIIVNNPVCEGDTLHLLVSPTYTGATYQWTGPNFTSNVPNPIIPNVTFSNQGRYQVIVSAGSCILPIAISDSVVVRARPLQPLVSGSSSVCVGGQNPNIDLNIIGNNLQGYTYIWYDAQTNLAVSPPTTDTTYTLNVSGYTIGQHSFYAIARDPNGCESVVSANWLVNFNQAPNETAFAGNDQQVCDDNANLSAAVVATGIGMWSSVNVGVQFVQPNQASTIVLNLHPGQNTLIWSLSIGGCGVYSQDSINVTYIPPATTTADTFNVDFGGTQTLTVLNNDTLPIGYNYILSIADSTQHGILSIVNNNEFFFRADATYKGLDSLVYKICSEQCPTDCVFGKVLLSIGTALGCDPPNIITPNGDGVNDAFIIPCIEAGKYPNVEVVIFNQWGDEVYRSKPYENNWQGTYQSSDLPIGTYFYVVDFGDASIKPKSGFLVIER
ncbi:MAG: gliding motility-associated C-terminal domain-containing protein, partial [Saprospiraceae bacterium]